MKKEIHIVSLILIISLILCGCAAEGERDQKEEKIQVIIEAISNKDGEALRSLLSKAALESENLQEGIDYCLALPISSDVEIEKMGSPESEKWEEGKHSHKISAAYLLKNGSDKYGVYFELWIDNEFDPDCIGINKLEIYRDNDFEGIDFEGPGIYYPQFDK